MNKTGLTEKEVLKNREKYGTNALAKQKANGFFKLFIDALGDPIIKILLIALAIKIVFLFKDFDWYETIGIVIAILFASFISSISEYGSEKAFKKLQEDASKIKCKVKRNGQIKEIYVEEVVKNDIVLLETGDKIPADGMIIEGDISVDESSLNGESKEAYKEAVHGIVTNKNKVFRGTTVYSKRALMLVETIGNDTVYGKMNLELHNDSPDSPLKLRLRKLAIIISRIGYIGALLVSLSYLFSVIVINNGFDPDKIMQTITNFPVLFGYLLYAMTLSVTIIVVAVPEGLPMMITLVLSSNMKRMLKNNVLVRKLVGIETAGSVNILFTDKTGTLTKGKLEVTEFLSGSMKHYYNEADLFSYPKLHTIVSTSILYNNASTYSNDKIIGGNITDRALLAFVKKEPIKPVQKLKITPFDSKAKYASTMIDNGNKVTLIKGAMEKILPYCTQYYTEEGFKRPLANKKTIENYINDRAGEGIRILVLATGDSYYGNTFKNLTLVGIISIKDDIRKEAIEGVKLVEEAGIKTVMLTGDNKNTAAAIGKEVGLLTSSKDILLTSDELNQMTEEEIKKILPHLKVVARSLPSDKTKLIKIAQSLDLVVGMTGDGVNDAPALKNADVGFAMGSGTEVAKEASDIVILDDNFLSISKAILFGRTIFKSIRKFIICQLTVNMCAIFLSFIGPFIGIDTPVTVIQMLWINMVMDTLTGLAFAFEPALLDYMKEKPKKKNESIINRYMFGEIFFTGIYSAILCILFLKLPFFHALFRNDTKYLMSAFFGLFIFIDIFNSFNARTHRLNLFANIFKNKVFLAIVTFIVIVQIILIYFGGSVFRTVGLTFKELQIMILLAASVIPIDFMRKLFLRKKGIIGGV
ncbi:MAG: calcium-translocating P-type ATPase, PMCA-type [Bacilli bacterium]|nr:calcium-translocating P-type ATPase, PMCA-type [Bacilli bacterium]